MSLCRRRFTRPDFDFVASVLAPEGTRKHVEKLWRDPAGLQQMLDLKQVLRSLLESPAALQVSPRFYFYVLVRHAFLDARLEDVELADYVAGVMARRIGTFSSDPLQDVTSGFTHAAEFLSFISSSSGRMRFHLHVAAGNQFLILTGLYPEYLKHRCEKGDSPGLEFYESFAQRSYRNAADNGRVAGRHSRQLLGTLAELLPETRRCLNRVAEEYLFLGA